MGNGHPAPRSDPEYWKRRIAGLDRKNCKTVKELRETLHQVAEAHAGFARTLVVAAVLSEYGQLVLETPKDTGRARAGWHVSPESSQWKPPGGLEEYSPTVPDRVRLSQADVIHIVNNVEYILALEAGWSAKAPNGFIGLFLQRLKSELNRIATAKRS